MRAVRAFAVPSAILIVACAAVTPSGAQPEEFDLDLFRPQVEVSAARTAARAFEDGTGDFEYASYAVSGTFPLGSTHVDLKGRVSAWQMFLQAQFGVEPVGIEALGPDDRDLYTGGLRAAALLLTRDRNLWWLSAGTSTAEDEETIDSPRRRFSAFAVGTRTLSPKVLFLYGGAFTYRFGRGLVLPIVGARFKAGEAWTITGTLPFTVTGTWQARQDLKMILKVSAAGNRYRFDNAGEFPGADDTIFLRLVQTKVSAGIDWKASRDVSILAEAGVSRARTVTFTDGDGDTTLLEDSTDPGGFVKVGARFSFGKTILTRLADARP